MEKYKFYYTLPKDGCVYTYIGSENSFWATQPNAKIMSKINED